MKPFLFWRDDWLLGFDHLDDQHLELVETLNNLHQLVLQKSKVGMDAICQQLCHYRALAHRHAETEEALMQKYGYPGLPNHHREHVMLLAELQEHIRDIEEGGRDFTLQTMTAIKHCQIDHLLYSDRNFANYLICQLPSNQVVDIVETAAIQISKQHDVLIAV